MSPLTSPLTEKERGRRFLTWEGGVSFLLNYSIRPVRPLASALILTHIFFGSLVERNEMVEGVIHLAIRSGLIGHFTKSICKMWVRIRALVTGIEGSFLVRGLGGVVPLDPLQPICYTVRH